jgi:hypothetical protein
MLREMLVGCDQWSSFAAASGCWEPLFRLTPIPLSFPEQRDLDEVEVHDGLVHLRNSHLKAGFAVFEPERLAERAALVWTHQAPSAEHHSLLGSERRWIYVLRDGRDVVNSWIHYATSPRMLARHPRYEARTPEELYLRHDYFAKLVARWVEHLEAYLALRDRYLEVRYEELLLDKRAETKRIADHLGLADSIDLDEVAEATSPERTRSRAPEHVRRAVAGDWRGHFDSRHEEIYRRLATPVIEALGRPEYLA